MQGKNSFFYVFLLLWGLLFGSPLVAQTNLLQEISKAESATFSLTAYNKQELPTDTARGFFIGANGLALTSTALLRNADTLVVSDHRNKNLALDRVIAIHPYANLALVRLAGYRNRDDGFLTPERRPYNPWGEVLHIAPRDDQQHRSRITAITQMLQVFGLGRSAVLSLRASSGERCAPLLNESGHFIGISHRLHFDAQWVMLPVYLLGDKNWQNVDQDWSSFKKRSDRLQLCDPNCCEGLLLQAMEKWTESARAFSTALRIQPGHPQILAWRALSRLSYGNTLGAQEDLDRCSRDPSAAAVTAYTQSKLLLQNEQAGKAQEVLLAALGTDDNLAEGFLLLGQIQQGSKEIRKAYASLSHALELDSLLAMVWYERGRLSMQYASDQQVALSDLETAARLNPFLPGIYTLIGSIHFQRNDYLKAIGDFDRALRINPADDHALMQRGMARFNTGLKEGACSDWSAAGRLGNTQAFRLISRHCNSVKNKTLQAF